MLRCSRIWYIYQQFLLQLQEVHANEGTIQLLLQQQHVMKIMRVVANFEYSKCKAYYHFRLMLIISHQNSILSHKPLIYAYHIQVKCQIRLKCLVAEFFNLLNQLQLGNCSKHMLKLSHYDHQKFKQDPFLLYPKFESFHLKVQQTDNFLFMTKKLMLLVCQGYFRKV